MGDGFLWLLGSLCGTFAVLKFVFVLWCLMELRRKWRSTPELWSIDWLDIVHRLEREVGVTLTAADFEGVPAEAQAQMTAGQLWGLVEARLHAAGHPASQGDWERFVKVLSESLNVKAERITSGSRLYADLGMVYGVD